MITGWIWIYPGQVLPAMPGLFKIKLFSEENFTFRAKIFPFDAGDIFPVTTLNLFYMGYKHMMSEPPRYSL